MPFAGQTVFVCGSGPSLTADVADSLRGRPVVTVNSSMLLTPSADVLFFTDNSWFEPRMAAVAGFGGRVVTTNSHSAKAMPEKVERMPVAWMPSFAESGSGNLRQGRSSGQTAISLARTFGASRVVLCGFDMRFVGTQEHCHDDYSRVPEPGLYATFVAAFAGWDADARTAGFEIVNATPGSALTEFPYVDLGDML